MSARTERLEQIRNIKDYKEYEALNPIERGTYLLLRWINANALNTLLEPDDIDNLASYMEKTIEMHMQSRGGWPGSDIPFKQIPAGELEVSDNVVDLTTDLLRSREVLVHVPIEVMDVVHTLAMRCAFEAIREEAAKARS